MTDLRARSSREAPRDGTRPRPDQVWLPRTEPTGPWSEIDPLVADRWYSRTASLTSVAMWGWIGVRVYRALGRGRPDEGVGAQG